MILNPSAYSFTPPSPAPESYLVELRTHPAQHPVVASVTLPGTATGGDFMALRTQVLGGLLADVELLLAVWAVNGSVTSTIVVDTTDVLTFRAAPGPVTNLVVTP
jgi:hypothetical protein